MANQTGAINDRLRSLLGASEPTEAQQETQPAKQPESKAETPKGDTKAEQRRVKAKLNDQEIEFDVLTEGVDLELIPKGLMMEADYRKKTSQVAEQRKAVEAEQEKVNSQLTELEQLLYGEAKYLDSDEGRQLQESDPKEYWKQRNKLDKKTRKLKEYRDQLNQQLTEKQKKTIEAERKKWTQAIPEWLDSDTMNADLGKMARTLKNQGFGEDDLSQVWDSRLVAIIRKAALFDELSSADVETKRTRRAPRTQSPGGGEAPPPRKSTARDRLKKSGKRSDAQGAIKELLGL